MSQERITELYQLIQQLERKIRPLEWDMKRNQINEFRKQQLERLQKEHAEFREELENLQG